MRFHQLKNSLLGLQPQTMVEFCWGRGGGGVIRWCHGLHTRLPPLRLVIEPTDLTLCEKVGSCLPMPSSLQCRIFTN